MNSYVKGVLLGLGCVALLYLVAFVVTGGNLLHYKVWAPRQEAAHRAVYDSTIQYNQGNIQELNNMRFEYERVSDPSQKQMLATVIVRRARNYGLEKLPPDLRLFVDGLVSQTTGL